LSASPRCFTGQVSVEFATSPTTTSGIHTMFPSGQHHEVYLKTSGIPVLYHEEIPPQWNFGDNT
jgi:hypothetical protein